MYSKLLYLLAVCLMLSSCGPTTKPETIAEISECSSVKPKFELILDYLIDPIKPVDTTGKEIILAGIKSHLEETLDVTVKPVKKECMCQKYLFEVQPNNPSITPEETLAEARHKIKQDGNENQVSAYLNIPLEVDPGTKVIKGPFNSFNEVLAPIKKENIIVGVVDGGIDKDLLSLATWINSEETGNNTMHGLDDDSNCLVDDLNGWDFTGDESAMINHGTLISSILLQGLDSLGKVRVMDLRIFDSNKNGDLFNALCALEYARTKNVDVLNLSWGYYSGYVMNDLKSYDSALLKHIQFARDQYIIVTSAGNEKENTDSCRHFPSGFVLADFPSTEHLIAVSATDNSGLLADYSNRGLKTVTLAALGNHSIGGENIKGTSYSAPIVSRSIVNYLYRNGKNNKEQAVACIKGSIDNSNNLEVLTRGEIEESKVQLCP